MSKIIELTQGKTTIVDDEDFEYLNQYNWFYGISTPGYQGYAKRNIKINNKKKLLLQCIK